MGITRNHAGGNNQQTARFPRNFGIFFQGSQGAAWQAKSYLKEWVRSGTVVKTKFLAGISRKLKVVLNSVRRVLMDQRSEITSKERRLGLKFVKKRRTSLLKNFSYK